MRKTDRLVNCADSQAVEVLVGGYLMWAAIGSWGVLAATMTAVGGLSVWSALHGALGPRKVACSLALAASAFLSLAPGQDAVPLAAAAAWAWYRTMLDSKVTS